MESPVKSPLKSLLDFRLPEQIRPLTHAQTLVFMKLLFVDPLSIDFAENEPPFEVGVILKRLRLAGVGVDPRLALLVGMFSESPADAVMWAHAITVMSMSLTHQGEENEVSIADWVRAFPDGPPTQEAMRECWAAQKDDGANRLDCIDAWKWTMEE